MKKKRKNFRNRLKKPKLKIRFHVAKLKIGINLLIGNLLLFSYKTV